MGLMDKLRNELVDIIEWIDDSRSTLAWRFPRYQNEIKNGAELIVREGQEAVFVYRGSLADRFGPGHYQLTSENLPLLSTLQGWKHGFNSPFRSEVYFINTRPVTDLRWGTPTPITVRDPDFKMVQVRANGLCVVKVDDAEIFLREVIGTDSSVEIDEITELLRRVITLNISLPEEITRAMTAGVARGVETSGFIDNVDLDRYQKAQAADAMVAAASNEGGSAMGDMMSMGMGAAMAAQMANQMGGAFNPQGQQAGAAPGGQAPPPLPNQGPTYHVAINGQQAGPFSIEQMRAGLANGQMTPESMVWAPGMAGWAAANTVPALQQLFMAPPPLPQDPPTPPTPPPAPPAQG